MVALFEGWLDYFGSDVSSLLIGLFVGLIFGWAAQQSRFCLRSAVIEFWRHLKGKMVLVWLIAFSMSFFLSQLFIYFGQIDLSKVKNLNIQGSLSGALIGGALFGVGMILSRGCASRLLVLSATGNLRAFMSLGFLAFIAYQTIYGWLSTPRSYVAGFYSLAPTERQISLSFFEPFGLLISALLIGVVIFAAFRSQLSFSNFISASLVGISIVLGWLLTHFHASFSFDIVEVETLSFIAPSVQVLKSLLFIEPFKPGFEIGMMMGVLVGAFIASFLSQEFKFVFFTKESGIIRYFVGAFLMGFGGVLAVGCSVGAGLTGVSVLSLTALSSLIAMIVFAGLTEKIFNRARS